MALPFYTGQVPTADDFNALMPKADLSASSGSSLVGYSQGGTNTVERTVEEKLREIVTPFDFGAVGDGVTNDRLALQRCLNYAMTVGAEVNLCGRNYACGGKLFINGALPIHLHDGTITAVGTSWGGTGLQTGAFVEVRNPPNSQLGHRIENIFLDCNYIARTGWYLRVMGPRTTINALHAVRFLDYGFWANGDPGGNNDVNIFNCTASEATPTDTEKYNDYSLRTGIAFFVDTCADITFTSCIGSSSKHELKIDGDFWNFKFVGGQFWNGPVAKADPTSITAIIGPNVKRGQFIGTRFDDGAVKLYNFNHRFIGCEFIQYTLGQLQLVSTAAGETAKNLAFIGNTVSIGATDVIEEAQLLTEGAGSWGTVSPEWIGNIVGLDGLPFTIQNKSLITNGLVIENGDVTLTGDVYIDGTKVVGPQEAGWTAATGTPNKGSYATYDGQTTSAVYDQAEAQATDDATKANSQRIKAIEDALRTHGLID